MIIVDISCIRLQLSLSGLSGQNYSSFSTYKNSGLQLYQFDYIKSHFYNITSVSKSAPSVSHVFIVSTIPTARAATSVKNVNRARVALPV